MIKFKVCVLILIVYLIVFGVILTIYLISKNDVQWSRRVLNTFKPCAFQGFEFEIDEKINKRTTPRELIFATSLFGNDTSDNFINKYFPGVLTLNEKIINLYPESQLRVYLANNISDNYKQQLIDANIEVFVMDNISRGYEGTLWRFYAADDDLPFVSVDADELEHNIVTTQYIKDIKSWLDSDNDFLVLKYDNSFWLPLTAGRWGAKPNVLKTPIVTMAQQYCDTTIGADEGFLYAEIFPQMKSSNVYNSGSSPGDIGFIILFIVIFLFFIFTLFYGCTKCNDKCSKSIKRNKKQKY
jgi:hypothetical protein